LVDSTIVAVAASEAEDSALDTTALAATIRLVRSNSMRSIEPPAGWNLEDAVPLKVVYARQI
jgi:hypothetical protein